MKISTVRIVVGALMLITVTASAAAAQANLYAARNEEDPSFPGVRGAASLYSLDPATAAPALIGPIGFDDVFTMDVHPLTGALYAVGRRPSDRVVVLITINTTSGVGSEVAPIQLSDDDLPIGIAFRHADGALFAVFKNVLQPVNLDGSTEGGFIIGVAGQQLALELGADDSVYSTDGEGGLSALGGDASFYQTFARSSTCGSDESAIRFCIHRALSIHPATGVLYSVTTRTLLDPVTLTLIQTDDYVTTLHPLAGPVDESGNPAGVVTIIGGKLPDGFAALAWSAGGPNTPAGTNVAVAVGPATLSFANVIQAGNTTATSVDDGPPVPPQFALGNPATYFDIETTALSSGTIGVCINYSGIAFANEGNLRLMHFENTAFVDVTTSLDTSRDIICGSVTSLSPFAVFERTVTPASPAQLIVDLIELLRRRALPAAMEARLVASLEAALVNPRTVSLTCSVLSRFIALVQVGAAQKFIPIARATELITRARAIRTALGC